MPLTLALRQALIVNQRTVEGSRDANTDISLASGTGYTTQSVLIPDQFGEAILWDSGCGGLTTFTHGFVKSDQDVWIQLRNDLTAGAQYVRLFVPANVVFGIAGKTAGDTTDAFDGSALVDNTDYADVDRIEVLRDSVDGTGDATVSLYLFS